MRHKNAGRENAGLENAAQSCRGWKMQEWKKREKRSMTQDTEVELSCTRESWHEPPPFQEKEQPTQRRPNKSVHLSL